MFTVGSRTITISYTATAFELPQQYKNAFAARGLTVNYAWGQGEPVVDNDYGAPGLPMAKGTVTASTGLWRVNQYFDAEVTVGASNPWKNGDPVVSPGTYGAFDSVAGVYYVRTGSGYTNNYLSMQNDGNLVYYNSANVPLWASGYVTGVEPRIVSSTGLDVQDVCGKRVSSCKARFGANNEIPFGSFPSVGSFYG